MSGWRKTDPAVREVSIGRFLNGRLEAGCPDWVAVEEPLEIRVLGDAVAVTMRTPGCDEDLAAGYLFTEGLIHLGSDVLEMAHCGRGDVVGRENILNVFLTASAAAGFQRPSPRGPVNVSCGLCGKTSIDDVLLKFPPVAPSTPPDATFLTTLSGRLAGDQVAFARTGGLHAAGVFDPDGNLLAAREDIGRHNAVDKAIGACLRQGCMPLAGCTLFVSGRASFEIVQKALAARIAVIASVSAPSSLAVEFAAGSGLTLVGFLRDGRFNVYAGEVAGFDSLSSNYHEGQEEHEGE